MARNLITDVAGLQVGNADDAEARLRRHRDRVRRAGGRVRSTCAAARPARAKPTCCEPDETVERVDAIVLSGGSAFGLDAPGGVQAWLREQGRGFAIGAMPACRSCRARSCSTCSMAATRTGAAFRPIASSAMRRPRCGAVDFALGTRRRRAMAPPPSISRAGSARPRRRHATAPRSARSSRSTRSAA